MPLDLKIYRKASDFEAGKKDPDFQKKPTIALELIDKSQARGERPSIVLIDGGSGNNSKFLKELEQNKLKYLGRVAKNRKVIIKVEGESEQETRLDQVAKTLSTESFEQVELKLSKPKKVWVKIFTAKVSSLEGDRSFAIVMNASSFEAATDIDYLMTNVEESKVTAQLMRSWISCSRMRLAATLRKRSIHVDFFVNVLKVSNPHQREEIWVDLKSVEASLYNRENIAIER